MDDVSKLVGQWIENESEDIITHILHGLSHGPFSLLEVIKALGPLLTADDGLQREKGLAFLSKLLGVYPSHKLTKQTVLFTFYLEKLEDPETISPVLTGLVCLASAPQFGSKQAKDLLAALEKQVKVTSLLQSTRLQVIRILDITLTRFLEDMKAIDDQYLRWHITFAQGEKDPRNLLLLFSLDAVVLLEFNVQSFIELFFDITFCYFPITFRPPPNDPYGISTEDLKAALRSCMSASPYFGPLAIPLFLEKLVGSTTAVKQDVLQTMSQCLPVYGPAATAQYGAVIWETLKVEIFQPVDTPTQDLAVIAIQAMVQALASNPSVPFYTIIDSISQEIAVIVAEPEKVQAKHAIKVLAALLRTTEFVATRILTATLPGLIDAGRSSSPEERQSHALQGFSILLASLLIPNSGNSSAELLGQAIINPWKNMLYSIITSAMDRPISRHAAIHLIAQSMELNEMWSMEEISSLVDQVNDCITVDDLRVPIVCVLNKFADSAPSVIEDRTLPLLFTALPDYAPDPTDRGGRATYKRALAILSSICSKPTLSESLVIRVFARLETTFLHVSMASSGSHLELTHSIMEHNAAYAHSLLSALHDVLVSQIGGTRPARSMHGERIITQICDLFLPKEETAASLVCDDRLLRSAYQIIVVVLQNLSASRQMAINTSILPRLYTPSVPSGTISQKRARIRCPILLAAMVIPMVEGKLPLEDTDIFLGDLLEFALLPDTASEAANAALSVVASFLNKNFIANDIPISWVQSATEELIMLQAVDKVNRTERHSRVLNANVWITQALLYRNDSRAWALIEAIFRLFDSPKLHLVAATAVGHLAKPREVLSKSNHAVTKPLHLQRFVSKAMPVILLNCRSSPDSFMRIAGVAALATLMKFLPKSTYAHQVDQLMPFLVLGMNLNEAELRVNVIDAITSLARSQPLDGNPIGPHAATVAKHLLSVITPKESSAEKLRLSALKCLGVLPGAVSYDVLHPYRTSILRQLDVALGDPKRAVRQLAVDTRAVWFAWQR